MKVIDGQLVGNATKHHLSNTRIYRIWKNMKSRCYCENRSNYKFYGGRGIAICNEWKNDFMKFYQWAIENGYKDGLTIDRIDNNGNYTPENCKWENQKEQFRNRRTSKMIFYNGKNKCLSYWGEIYGIKTHTLLARINRGWSFEKSINEKVRKCNIELK